MTTRRDFRESRLLASPNRFKLATFGFNAQGGSTITKAPGTADTDWDSQVRIAQASDAADIEALIPGARWKGYGGETDFQGRSYETLAWAAGLAALTKRTQVFATVHMTTIHPVRLAKTIATIDHIAGGRLGINWVAGWNAAEFAMFGADQREHDERYEFGEDFLAVVNALLDRPGEFSHDGPYFKLDGLYSEPKPIQSPRPVYMGAGFSPRGRRFAGAQADINFVASRGGAKAMAPLIADTKAMARQGGREIKVFGQATIYCRDSRAEAQAYHDWCVDEMGDRAAGENLVRDLFAETRDDKGNLRGAMPPQVRDGIVRSMIGGHGSVELIGTPTEVVEQMVELADAGMDGTTLSWVDFEAGLSQFRDAILPLMIDAGLRVDESAAGPATSASIAEARTPEARTPEDSGVPA